MRIEHEHTPGPWFAAPDGGAVYTKVMGYRDETIARTPAEHIPAEEREANARLIAAAPDLLAVLERVLNAPPYGGLLPSERGFPVSASLSPALRDLVRETISKALEG